jgi:hypothetical protein
MQTSRITEFSKLTEFMGEENAGEFWMGLIRLR